MSDNYPVVCVEDLHAFVQRMEIAHRTGPLALFAANVRVLAVPGEAGFGGNVAVTDTICKPAGTVVWPAVLSPHAITEPSLLRATL